MVGLLVFILCLLYRAFELIEYDVSGTAAETPTRRPLTSAIPARGPSRF